MAEGDLVRSFCGDLSNLGELKDSPLFIGALFVSLLEAKIDPLTGIVVFVDFKYIKVK